jgi:ribosomal protein S1
VARTYNGSGFIYEGRIEGYNGGGLLVRFYSLVGFLPFSQLSPSHSCKGTTFLGSGHTLLLSVFFFFFLVKLV